MLLDLIDIRGCRCRVPCHCGARPGPTHRFWSFLDPDEIIQVLIDVFQVRLHHVCSHSLPLVFLLAFRHLFPRLGPDGAFGGCGIVQRVCIYALATRVVVAGDCAGATDRFTLLECNCSGGRFHQKRWQHGARVFASDAIFCLSIRPHGADWAARDRRCGQRELGRASRLHSLAICLHWVRREKVVRLYQLHLGRSGHLLIHVSLSDGIFVVARRGEDRRDALDLPRWQHSCCLRTDQLGRLGGPQGVLGLELRIEVVDVAVGSHLLASVS